jgi:predicted permease
MALAMALLIGAGLFLRSLLRLQETPLGYRPEGVLTVRVGANFNERPEATVQRHQRMLETLSAIPGVTAVAMSAGLPGVNPAWPREFDLADERSPDGALRFATWRIVTAGYFETVGIPILQGRTCRMTTNPAQAFEILVNRSFVDQYSPGRDPIGRIILKGPVGDNDQRIVGIVTDSREDGQGKEPQPLIYACGYLRYWPDSDILIHTRSPADMANAVRAALQSAEPSRPIYSLQPMTVALQGALSQTRFRALLVGLFSMMALTLAAIGLYGVMAYMVSQRTREIGIRMALGARPGQIVGEILRSGGVLTSAGAVAGTILAVIASRLMVTLLYEVEPTDPATHLSAAGVLFGVALLACLIPSHRATSVDPTKALRDQ